MFGFSGKAEASAYASSILEVDDASFSGTGFSGFTSFQFILRQLSATLNATTVNSPGSISKFAAGSVLDQPVTCISSPGSTCGTFVNNVFFPSTGPDSTLGSYAVADSHELDTVIGGATATGNWGSLGQAQLEGPLNASAATGTNNTLQWNFTSAGGTVTFNADLTQNFEVFLSGGGVNATASANFTVEIQQGGVTIPGGTLFNLATFNPDCFNTTITTSAGNAHPCNDATFSDIGGSVVLAPGDYSLLIRFDTSADVVQAVPEPASLVLMGIGFVAVGMITRRRFGK